MLQQPPERDDKMNNIGKFEEIIKYTFKNKQLIHQALTHSSYANERKHPNGSNERLEFLGDSVLSIVVSDFLYKNLNVAEGQLTETSRRFSASWKG